jgi:hypothetical protein
VNKGRQTPNSVNVNSVNEDKRIVCSPSVHFSGRMMYQRDFVHSVDKKESHVLGFKALGIKEGN